MSCGCGKTNKIKSAPPYANYSDVMAVLGDLCANCVVQVPNGTDVLDFEAEGWGSDGYPECCQELTVYIAETEEIWKSQDGVTWCNICGGTTDLENRCVAIVPPTTLEANFLTVGFGGAVPAGCKELTVLYSDNSDAFIQVAGESTWNSIVKRVPPTVGKRFVTGGTLKLSAVGGAIFGTIDATKSYDPEGFFGVTGRTITIPANTKGKLQIIHNLITTNTPIAFSTSYINGFLTYTLGTTTYEASRASGFAGVSSASQNYGAIANVAFFGDIVGGEVFTFTVFSSVTDTPIIYETINYIFWEE